MCSFLGLGANFVKVSCFDPMTAVKKMNMGNSGAYVKMPENSRSSSPPGDSKAWEDRVEPR
jgi:hypothetical protein